jgi:AcrR family transcriptional regulator
MLVRVRLVAEIVKGRQKARVTQTEERIIRAATRLFIARGYQGTTLAQVADVAGVSPRTVYVRFGTKAELLKRATDVALVGDARPVDVAHRDWFQSALTARTLSARTSALAEGTADLMHRTGDLFEVLLQAQVTEPLLAEALQAGRAATRENVSAFVRVAADDGLLHTGADTDWLGETAAVVLHAETYLLLRRTRRWGDEDYRDWLLATLHRLIASA